MVNAYLEVDNMEFYREIVISIQKGLTMYEREEYDRLETHGRDLMSDANDMLMKEEFFARYILCWSYIFVASALMHKGQFKESREHLDVIYKISREWLTLGKEDEKQLGFRFFITTIRQQADLSRQQGEYEEAEKIYLDSFDLLNEYRSTRYGKEETIKVFEDLRDLKAGIGEMEDVIRYSEIIMKEGCQLAISHIKEPTEFFSCIINVCMDSSGYLEGAGLLQEAEQYLMRTADWIQKRIQSAEKNLEREKQQIHQAAKEDLNRLESDIAGKEAILRKTKNHSIYPMMACANLLLKQGKETQAGYYYTLVHDYLEEEDSQ